MTEKKKNPRGRLVRNLTWAALCAALVISGLTIYELVRERDSKRPDVIESVFSAICELVHKPQPAEESFTGPDQAQEVIARAAPLVKQRAYKPAIDLMQAYVRSVPRDIEVRPLLAQAQLASGDREAAGRTIDTLIALARGMSRGWWLKGQLAREKGDPNYIAYFRKAAKECVDPTPETWSLYGQELLARGQTTEARAWLEKAWRANFRDAATSSGLGQLALLAEQYPQACTYLQGAVTKDRNNSESWCLLVIALKKSGKLRPAQRTAEEALKIRETGELYMELADVLAMQDQPLPAAQAYARASIYRPFRGEAAVRSAELYYQMGRYSAAIAQIDAAAELRPDDPNVIQLRTLIEDKHFGKPKASGR